MPRQSLQLNDFSGGLNTKSSPRDIAPNEVQKSDNVVLSEPGLIQSSSNPSDKSSAISKNNTDNFGTGAFVFNHEYDINDSDSSVSQTARQIIAYPDSTTLEFFYRAYNTTGNFSDANTANAITMSDGNFEPVYYYVDGVLYIADRDRVDTSNSFTQKALQLINTPRFNTTVAEWVVGDAAPAATTDDMFVVENDSSVSTPDTAGEIAIGFDTTPTQTNILNIYDAAGTSDSDKIVTIADPGDPSALAILATADTASIFVEDKGTAQNDLTGLITGDLAPGEYIYLNDEIMLITDAVGASTSSVSYNYKLRLSVQRGMFGSPIQSHPAGTELKKSTVNPIGGGTWEEGEYEFTYTLVNQTGDETLPHTPESTTALIAFSKFFQDIDVKVNIEGTFRKREKGFRVYTRIKDSNDRWILFLDGDYERGVRTNLFEDYTAWSLGSGNTYGDGDDDGYAYVEGLQAKAPALDTYESINGYAQTEKSISLGSKGGYKAATVCSRRAWIANVRKDDVVYDDRIYYSPVNKFATFPDSFYLDIGINDGDSFTALHSLGNRVLAFKQKKLYIINVSSSSDAGWYLEAEYDGVGCDYQESVTKTPFGICWVNNDGVFIFDGQNAPVELSLKINDKTWRDNSSGRPAIGYNNKYKQLVVCQNSSTTSSEPFYIYDFATRGWSTTNSMSNGMSNFFSTSDGLYFIEYASSGHNKTIKLLTGDTGTKQIVLQTKDIDFGNPGLVKKVKKVYVTAKDDGGAGSGNTLTLKYALDGSTSFGNAATATATDGLGQFDTLTYTINQNCQSIALELTDEDGEAITINDINIDCRLTNKRPS